MGGYGSGRWQWHNKKTTVEECRLLTIDDFLHNGFLKPGQTTTGIITRWFVRDQEVASIGIDIHAQFTERAWFRIHYKQSDRLFDYRVDLTTTEPHFGGVQWWFVCPLCHESRCRKIYLPPAGGYFGCRSCHDLTYTSSQESDKRVSQLRKMPVLDLLQKVNDGSVDFILGLKAIPDHIWRL